jgi:hypothetical protein
MPDTVLISAIEFSANFAEAEASGADVVKIVRDGQVVGGYLSARCPYPVSAGKSSPPHA